MIIDADNVSEPAALSADVCIVGAGAAGISLALQFIGTKVEVLLLESGGLGPEVATQALYEGQVVDERLHSPPDRYRQRRFGGTTTIWGGRCMPFDPIDFEPRDYVAHSGWPISYADLLPFYPEANRLCEAGDFCYAAGDCLGERAQPMIAGFQSDSFSSDTLERFSCPTDFGARYGHRLRAAGNIQVVLHANVCAVNLRPSGDCVQGVEVRTLRGRLLRVRASHFVLAAGGLEVTRLLLASSDVQANGIGNRHDVLGRYYMCHLAGTIGALQVRLPAGAVHHGYEISDEGVYCRRRLALRAAAQRSHRIGNFVARLHHPRIADAAHRNGVLSLLYLARPLIPYEYRKRLHDDDDTARLRWLGHVRNMLVEPFAAVAFAWHMLRDRKLAERKFPSIIVRSRANLYSLDFHAEQQPNAASRMTLDDSRDALGVPRLRVDWRYTAADVDTVRRAIALLARDFADSGVGNFDYSPDAVETEMVRYGAYGGHHIGTARMGNDVRTSVVDRNCRVHEIENLFVASTATFATSSQANPTLTLIAFSLRLASHLRTLLSRAPTALTGNDAAQPSAGARAGAGRIPA